MIGIGLNDEKDISVKGLETIKKCDFVYLENYTSKLNCTIKDLEKLYGKKVILADRELVEKKAAQIIENAKKQKVAFLVIGDVFSATTHADIFLMAKKEKIKVKVIPNASVISAVGITGLEVYKFGKITSIPFENKKIKSPIDVFNKNYKNDLHTLFLLDIKKDKLMTINEAVDFLIKNKIDENMMAVACAALGSDEPFIKYAKLEDLKDIEVNKFPQCLIIPAKLHFIEEEMLNSYPRKEKICSIFSNS